MSPRKRGVGLFLSTPSGWRATLISESYKKDAIDFYPRPPGGGRPISRHSRAVRGYFYPRPPGGGRRVFPAPTCPPTKFLSTPSGWRATRKNGTTDSSALFLSTPSGWRATVFCVSQSVQQPDFYPRPPGGGRPASRSINRIRMRYFYPRPPGGGRHALQPRPPVLGDISIHALRVEGDLVHTCSIFGIIISIHALRVEGDRQIGVDVEKWTAISIHALRVEGDSAQSSMAQISAISIHALRVEGDIPLSSSPRACPNFYPRPPGGGRRAFIIAKPSGCFNFYPRPPGGGRPHRGARKISRRRDFYPRPPGGGRRRRMKALQRYQIFLSTPSGWRATTGAPRKNYGTVFLSTPSGWRATGCDAARTKSQKNFYPRPPGGGRHERAKMEMGQRRFLSTPSGWRATRQAVDRVARGRISIHALRVEGDW